MMVLLRQERRHLCRRILPALPQDFRHPLGHSEHSALLHCWQAYDYMSNASLRERFSLSDEEYQSVSSVIADARKAKRIIPADQSQGNRNARYVPYWAA
jgi:hypothetical protein